MKHMVYSTDFDESEAMLEEYNDWLEANEYDEADYSFEDYERESNQFWLESEQDNLNTELEGRIIALADLGLWNGRRPGYRILETNLRSIFNVFQGDYFDIYWDGYDLQGKDSHHDGTNHYVFVVEREDKDVDDFLQMFYDGKVEMDDWDVFNQYTRPITEVAEIYGWDVKEKEDEEE